MKRASSSTRFECTQLCYWTARWRSKGMVW